MTDIDFDENGWAAIHHCMSAEKELLMSIENYVNNNAEYLEVETRDGLQMTPLLLAVQFSKKKSVEKLVTLGASLKSVNAQNHGVIEICVLNENISILHYFIEKENEDFKVWDMLVNFVNTAATNEVSEKVTKMIFKLTVDPHPLGENECSEQHWQQLVRAGGVATLIKQCKSSSSNTAKLNILNVFKNIINCEGVAKVIVQAGGIPLFIDIMKGGFKLAMYSSITCLQEICNYSDEYAIAVYKAGFLTDALKILQQSRLAPDTSTSILEIICHITRSSNNAKVEAGKAPKIFELLLLIFKKTDAQSHIPLLTAATRAIGSIIEGNIDNQIFAVDEGTGGFMLLMAQAIKYKQLQLSAIKVLFSLSCNNQYAVSKIVSDGGVRVLLNLLRKSRDITLREALARTLWSLAGPNTSGRYTLASAIGAGHLIESLGAQGENADSLNCIACDGLATLAYGSFITQKEMNEDGGVSALVRLLRSPNELVLKAALRALRYSCLGVGYIANAKNQTAVSTTRGLKLLVSLLAYSKSEEIQVQAALAIAAAVSGHADNSAQLKDNTTFSYLLVIRLLYSDERQVRLSASNALATFCYNSITLQQEIANFGGIRWHNFAEFLECDNDTHATEAAFQVVVMSRIIPDKEPAESAAIAINIMVEVLQKSSDEGVLALSADCIARLSHTRAGISSAFVSINAVHHLFTLMESPSEQVRGSVAIALGYLTFDHEGERQLLSLCRDKPHLVHGIKYYTKMYKLSPLFIERWKHSVLISRMEIKSDMIKKQNDMSMQLLMYEPKMPSTPLTSMIEEMSRQESGHMHRSKNRTASRDDLSQDSSRATRKSTGSPNLLPHQSHMDKPDSSVAYDDSR